MIKIPKNLQDYVARLNLNRVNMDDVQYRSIGGTLIRKGAFYPHADAFAYNGKAVILFGMSGVGKSTLVREFARNLGGRVLSLAEDFPAIYANARDNPVVYEDDIRSHSDPFFAPFLFPGDVKEYEVDTLVHLKDGRERKLCIGDVNELIHYFPICSEAKREVLEKVVRESFQRVPVISYTKVNGNNNQSEINTTFRELKKAIDDCRAIATRA